MKNGNLEPLGLADAKEEVEKDQIQAPVKAKKPHTQAQIDAFAKVVAKREENRKERKSGNEIIEQDRKRVLDEKIIKKAKALEKKGFGCY